MNTQPLGPFLGVNNRLPDFALRVDKQGDYLRDAVNAEVDNAGRLRRRQGLSLVQTMTGAHSVYAVSSATGLLVRASALYKFSTTPTYTETLVKVLTSNTAVSYETWNGDIYYSNGVDSGRVSASGTWSPWALPSPTAPMLTATSGFVHKGKYQVSVTYGNSATGEEGGCAGSTTIDLSNTGGIRVALPAAVTGATHIHIYSTPTNGSNPLHQATVAIGPSTYDITSIRTDGRQVHTAFEEPLPPGTQVVLVNGRLCSVYGGTVYAGKPFRPGYYLPSEGYIPFEGSVSNVVPAQNGTYIVADKTRWFAGADVLHPDTIQDVLPYGGVHGTAFKVPNSSSVGWFGAQGVVLADIQGQADAAMSDNVELVPPSSGVSVVVSGEYRRVHSCGWTVNLLSKAATRNDLAITSASGSFATTDSGLYVLSGDDDAGQPIESMVDFGKQNFGSEMMKRMPATYLGCSSSAAMTLTISTPEDISYTYETRSYSSDLRVQRVDVGRGLRANWFSAVVTNQLGSDFTLASVGFGAMNTIRRI